MTVGLTDPENSQPPVRRTLNLETVLVFLSRSWGRRRRVVPDREGKVGRRPVNRRTKLYRGVDDPQENRGNLSVLSKRKLDVPH